MRNRWGPAPIVVLCAGLAGACAAVSRGDMNRNIALPSNVLEPARPLEPRRAPGFPAVVLLVDRTHRARGRTEVAYLTPMHSPAATPETRTDATPAVASNTPTPTSEPAKTEAPAPEPAKAEPAKTETPKPGPGKTEPAKTETPATGTASGTASPEPAKGETPKTEAATTSTDPSQVISPPSSDRASLEAAKRLPPIPGDATELQRKFIDDAGRAIRRVYDEGFDDPVVLQSLRDKLRTTPDLGALNGPWSPILDAAIERAKGLGVAGWAIRRLRAAFKDAVWDSGTGVYRKIGQRDCRLAFQRINQTDPRLMSLVIDLPPIGAFPLERFETFCVDSNGADLMDRDFPSQQGPPKLRALVRKIYGKTFPGVKVHRVSIDAPWQAAEGKPPGTKILRATVGVERKNAFPDDPCVTQSVVIEQAPKSKPTCGEVTNELAISCDILKR